MFLFTKFKLLIFILIFSSCLSVDDKKIISSDEKFYIVENIHENDVVEEITEKYDANKMVFVKGGKFNFGSNTGLELSLIHI